MHSRFGDPVVRSRRPFRFSHYFTRFFAFVFAPAWIFFGNVPAASGAVVISEFMAINNTTLKDEDGAYSDWIELYNSGTNTVNLAGWYLSNKSTNLTQWQFPSTNNATNLLARVDQLTNYLWEAQARDFVAWPRLGTYVWPNPDGAAGGWDVDYVNPTTYSGIIAQFKKFILGRYLWIDQQFVRAPTLSSNGSNFTLNAPLGSIYYTLDGTDPRASGGGINGTARPYTGALALTSNAAIFARAFYTNAWSAPTRSLYIDSLPTLRITEIDYHPAAPPANSPYTDKDFEFVEVQNTGTNALNLAGAHIGGGIDFTFVPNEIAAAGNPTSNNFDQAGTPFVAATLAQNPGPYLTNDGPAGNLLRLLDTDANVIRNRIAFNQTAVGNYDRLTVEFDFRASIKGGGSAGGPTMQNFDTAGNSYLLTSRGTSSPAVLAQDTNSTGNFLRLVPSSGQQLGVISFAATAPGPFHSIVATFDFRITPSAGAVPADGLGFALLNTAVYGTNGAGPYFSEEPNLSSSLGVGFDVYNNSSTPQEPNNNHVSVHWNGAQIGNAVTPSFSMSSGKFHRAQIIIWFNGNNAYVTVRLTPDINGSPGPTETVLQNALVSGATPYPCRAAFGARTGGAWAAHDLDNVNVQFTQNDAAAAGLSLLLLPASQFGATGGTTISAFADAPLVPNTLALDLAFNSASLFNDVELYWNKALAAGISLPQTNLTLNGAVFHHAHWQLDSVNGGVSSSLILTPNSLGAPGTPVAAFTNRFIPEATLGDTRLEFAARNSGLPGKVDVDNVTALAEAWQPLVLAPGGCIVVVHNLAAFRSRYGNSIPVAGEFSGSLANEGEELTLHGPLGEQILDFRYLPSWYPSTDGQGYSLVTVNPYAPVSDWGLAANWGPSLQPGGSPGAPEPGSGPVLLSITAKDSGPHITLAWPSTANGYALYSAPSPGPLETWRPVTNVPSSAGDKWFVSISASNRLSSYFRLQKQ